MKTHKCDNCGERKILKYYDPMLDEWLCEECWMPHVKLVSRMKHIPGGIPYHRR